MRPPRTAWRLIRSVEVGNGVVGGDGAAPSAGSERQTAGFGPTCSRNLARGPARGQAGFLCCSTVLALLFRIAGLAGCGVARVAPAGLDHEGMYTHGHPPRRRHGASPDRGPRAVAGHAAWAPVVHRARDGCWRRRARQRGGVRPAGPFPASCDARLWAWGVQCVRARDALGERSAQRQRTQHRDGPAAARGTSPARRAAACVPQPVTQPPASTAPRPGQGSGPQTPWTLGARGLSRVCPAVPASASGFGARAGRRWRRSLGDDPSPQDCPGQARSSN